MRSRTVLLVTALALAAALVPATPAAAAVAPTLTVTVGSPAIVAPGGDPAKLFFNVTYTVEPALASEVALRAEIVESPDWAAAWMEPITQRIETGPGKRTYRATFVALVAAGTDAPAFHEGRLGIVVRAGETALYDAAEAGAAGAVTTAFRGHITGRILDVVATPSRTVATVEITNHGNAPAEVRFSDAGRLRNAEMILPDPEVLGLRQAGQASRVFEISVRPHPGFPGGTAQVRVMTFAAAASATTGNAVDFGFDVPPSAAPESAAAPSQGTAGPDSNDTPLGAGMALVALAGAAVVAASRRK